MQLKMSQDALHEFLAREFPQVADDYEVTALAPMQITMRAKIAPRHLRPGGTVSGPTMFALADVSIYLATLAMIGPKALAVTTNCSIDFMRKPAAGQDLIATARLLKLGRTLAVGDVMIFSAEDAEDADKPVARASMTYAIPPERS